MAQTVECCGKACGTPYCPHCGKRARPEHPLSGLLAYLRARLTATRSEGRRAAQRAAELTEGSDRRRRLQSREQDAARRAVQLEVWINVLAPMIGEE